MKNQKPNSSTGNLVNARSSGFNSKEWIDDKLLEMP